MIFDDIIFIIEKILFIIKQYFYNIKLKKYFNKIKQPIKKCVICTHGIAEWDVTYKPGLYCNLCHFCMNKYNHYIDRKRITLKEENDIYRNR